MSTIDDGQTAHTGDGRPEEAKLAILWKAAEGDQSALESLWQAHGRRLLRVACAFANSDDIDRALMPALRSDPEVEQLVLKYSAYEGNEALFQHMLQRIKPQPSDLGWSQPGIFLRLGAIAGGVKIWRALLAYNPDCLHWDIGGQGDPLVKAVMKKDTELVHFLLAEGADVKRSNSVGMPVLACAKRINAGPEIIGLLTSYGAPTTEAPR